MTRALIWDPVYPSRSGKSFPQGWLPFHVEASTILGMQAPLLMPHTSSPIQERANVHAEEVYSLQSIRPSTNGQAQETLTSHSVSDLLQWSTHCSNQPSFTSYFQLVTLHLLLVLIHFRSKSLSYLILVPCSSQDGV
jgi:hypothetical protein